MIQSINPFSIIAAIDLPMPLGVIAPANVKHTVEFVSTMCFITSAASASLRALYAVAPKNFISCETVISGKISGGSIFLPLNEWLFCILIVDFILHLKILFVIYKIMGNKPRNSSTKKYQEHHKNVPI